MDIQGYDFFKKLTQLPFIKTIWLFGSRARGDHQDRADIDLAIACPEASNDNWLAILDIIDNADTLLKIDCVRYDILSNSSSLKEAIIRDGKIIYSKYE